METKYTDAHHDFHKTRMTTAFSDQAKEAFRQTAMCLMPRRDQVASENIKRLVNLRKNNGTKDGIVTSLRSPGLMVSTQGRVPRVRTIDSPKTYSRVCTEDFRILLWAPG